MEKEKPSVEIHPSMSPLAWLYGLGVNFRNSLFDRKILKQHTFDIPIICVGNLTVGGTGKTPHIEYLLRLLLPEFKVAVLSRGYKRKKKGFIIVDADSKACDVGDEPLQIKQKFPNSLVVVDKNRVNAIRKILTIEKEERPDVILLDDGFQHRHVLPSLSILLVDSHRPVFEDRLLPEGSLREPLKAKERAAILLVTKCDPDMQPIDQRIYMNGLNLFAFQKLYFTGIHYGEIIPLFPELGYVLSSPNYSANGTTPVSSNVQESTPAIQFATATQLQPSPELMGNPLGLEDDRPGIKGENQWEIQGDAPSVSTDGRLELQDLRKKHVFLVAGIASPQPLVEKLEYFTYNLHTKFFPDHHAFDEKDIQSIREMVDAVDDNNKIILTTEKDAVRLKSLPYLDEEMKKMLYYIPVDVEFIEEDEQVEFNNNILGHVRNYHTNSRLSQE